MSPVLVLILWDVAVTSVATFALVGVRRLRRQLAEVRARLVRVDGYKTGLLAEDDSAPWWCWRCRWESCYPHEWCGTSGCRCDECYRPSLAAVALMIDARWPG